MTTLIAVALLSALAGLAVGAIVAAHVEEQRRARTHIREQLEAYGRGYRAAARDILNQQGGN